MQCHLLSARCVRAKIWAIASCCCWMHHRNVGWSSHHNLWIPIGEKVYLFVSLLLFGLSSGKRPWKIINSGAAFLRLPQQNARGTKGAVNEKEEDKCARLERCWLGDCLCTVLQYLRKHPHKQTHTHAQKPSPLCGRREQTMDHPQFTPGNHQLAAAACEHVSACVRKAFGYLRITFYVCVCVYVDDGLRAHGSRVCVGEEPESNI